MLNKDELGSFILVLANSMQDQQLFKSLTPELKMTFGAIKNNKNLSSSPDDLHILNSLTAQNISQYSAWAIRNLNHWQCAFNPFRSLRPERSSKDTFTSLRHPFNDDAFHFSKPFLRPEILSEERFEDLDLQVMYQKFPFAPYHLLIVLHAAIRLPQSLNKKNHFQIYSLAAHMHQRIQGFKLAYNSLGAGASVNQLHIHSCINETPLAIESSDFTHNSGNTNYPIPLTRTSSAKDSWALIEQYHSINQPYNLLYSGDYCYVIPRKPQGSVISASWLSNMGWYEACGGFNLHDSDDYQNLTTVDIQSELAKYALT